MFDAFLERRNLIPIGEVIVMHAARLLSVSRDDMPTMPKSVSMRPDTDFGGATPLRPELIPA